MDESNRDPTVVERALGNKIGIVLAFSNSSEGSSADSRGERGTRPVLSRVRASTLQTGVDPAFTSDCLLIDFKPLLGVEGRLQTHQKYDSIPFGDAKSTASSPASGLYLLNPE